MGIIASLLPAKGKAKYLVSHVEVASLVPGRLRVIYADLKHDESLRAQVNDELAAIKEVNEFSINPITGSVVINYDTNLVAQNAFLSELLLLAAEKLQKTR